MFEPGQMQDLAEKMIAGGTMPSPEQFLEAMEQIRAKYAERILKAREEDRLTNERDRKENERQNG